MKKLYNYISAIVILISISYQTFAQNEFYNNGALVTLLNGSGDATPTLFVSGSVTNNNGIINNNASFLQIESGNFTNTVSSYYYQSTGKEMFSGAVNNTISGTWNGTSANRNQFYNLKINKTGATGENIILNSSVTGNTVNINAAGTLEFTSTHGIIRTQTSSVTSAPYTGDYTNTLYIQNPSASAIIGHSTAIASKTKYIEGKLRRQVNVAAAYFFPIGVVNTGLDGMEAFNLTFNSAPTSKSILGYIRPASVAPSYRNVLSDVGTDPGPGNDPFPNCIGGPDGIYDLYYLDATNDLSHEWMATASDAVGTINYDATFYPGSNLDALGKYYVIPGACGSPYSGKLIRVVAKDGIVGGTRQIGPGNWAPWKHLTTYIWSDFATAGQQAITLGGQTSFSSFRIHGTNLSSSTALPVELISFTITPVNNTYFDLHWQTASELNNAGFYVQRSVDGATFENIGWVAGNGNSTTLQSYTFTDRDVQTDITYYYRLQQVDYDQKVKNTYILSGRLDGNSFNVINIQPNPTFLNPQAIVQAPKDGNLQLDIYDVSGRILKTSYQPVTKGNNQFEIDMDVLAKASYLVRFIFNDEVVTKKIIKY